MFSAIHLYVTFVPLFRFFFLSFEDDDDDYHDHSLWDKISSVADPKKNDSWVQKAKKIVENNSKKKEVLTRIMVKRRAKKVKKKS